ncbi:MAG: hypothetical protein ACTS4V_01195 [Candidatus Hodgkinia cicadicola]
MREAVQTKEKASLYLFLYIYNTLGPELFSPKKHLKRKRISPSVKTINSSGRFLSLGPTFVS